MTDLNARDGYALVRLLGSGGMGEVWEALPEREGSAPVALKLIRPDRMTDELARMRFARECDLLSRLSHPGIAKLLCASVDPLRPYLAMELLRGATLADVILREQRLSVVRAAEIGIEVSRALRYAHQAGIIHRDIKPSNIVIEASRVVLTDFGVAFLSAEQERLTVSGAVAGTPAYAAPEIVKGERPAAAADVYSLGVVLFECITGRLPFDGDSAISQAVARLVRTPLRLRDIRPDVSERAERLIMRCLAEDPASRPDLTQLESELLSLQADESTYPPRRTRRRRYAVAAGGGLLAAAVATALVTGFVGERPSGVPREASVRIPAPVAFARPPGDGAPRYAPAGQTEARTLTVIVRKIMPDAELRGLTPLTGEERGPEFYQGDEILIEIATPANAFYYVLHTSSDGETHTLLHSGRPDEESRQIELGPFRIDPPSGVERIRVLATESEVVAASSDQLRAELLRRMAGGNLATAAPSSSRMAGGSHTTSFSILELPAIAETRFRHRPAPRTAER